MIHAKKVKFKEISIPETEGESFFQKIKRVTRDSYELNHTQAASKELQDLEHKIELAAVKGDYGIDVLVNYKITIKTLRDMGFICIPIDITSHHNYHISWQ